MRSYHTTVDLANDTLVRGHCLVPEHVKHVVELVNTGRDRESDAIGLHGTSLAALVIAMKTGYLPAGRSPGCEGGIYFFPLSHAHVLIGPELLTSTSSGINDREAFVDVAGYAHDSTQYALGAQALGLDMSSDVGWRLATNLSEIVHGQDLAGAELLETHGVHQRQALQLVRALEKIKRGFVLLIGKSALEECQCGTGDPGYGDLKLQVTGQGLSLNHIVGIEPLSREDFDTVRALQKRCNAS
jgi:hypothetical protein